VPNNSDMVVHAYFSSPGESGGGATTTTTTTTGGNTYYRNDYREAILGRRSPVKNNAFRRTSSHSSSRKNKKWCVCGRQLVFFKDAECYACTECGHTEYIEQKKEQLQQQHTLGSSGTAGGDGVISVDGLSDARTTPNRAATKFRSIKDPRSRFLKPKSQLDPELQKLVDEQGVTIISYNERVEEDSQLVSSNELRSNK
jgi:hypothetical protein